MQSICLLLILSIIIISSGKAANEGTKNYLLGTLKRGRTLRLQFGNECSVDGSQFLKPVARIKILNFAAENRKRSKTGIRKVSAAEGVRDVFGRILAVAMLPIHSTYLAISLQKCLFLLPIVMGFPLRLTRQLSQKLLKANKKLFWQTSQSKQLW